jgi:hypothetical protein
LSDIFDLEFVEPLASQVRDNMQASKSLIFFVRLGRKVRPDDLLQPIGEELSELRHVGADRSAACLVLEPEPCLLGGFVGLGP